MITQINLKVTNNRGLPHRASRYRRGPRSPASHFPFWPQKTGAAEAFSHEGYGHALLYIRNGHNHEVASHQIKGMQDTNIILVNMILDARRTTINNLQK